MFISRFFIISAACLLLAIAGLSAAQQYTDNSVNEQQGDSFDYEEQQQPAVATPTRFQSKPQASSFRSRTTFSSAAQPQTQAPRAPPVQILKQINRHNEDGSYTYGFEGSDGSFKIETKLANGEVKGKYGYVDDSGKVRVVEYGANKYGFQPAGEGITVAPPTLVDESKVKKNKKVPATGGQLAQFIPVNEEVPEYDDGQYYEQPQPQQQVPVRSSQRSGPAVRPRARPAVAAPVQAAPAHIPRPSANFEFGTSQDFSGYQEQQSFQGRSSSGPVPPPAQIPGAIPVPSNEGSAQRIVVPGSNFVTSSRSASAQQQVRPAPQFLFQQSAPSQERQAPRAAARNFPSSGSSSSFDELEKQFALPSGGSPPTHDISFSAYF